MAESFTNSRTRREHSHKFQEPPRGRFIDTFHAQPTHKLSKDPLRFGSECTLNGIATYHKDARAREIRLGAHPATLQLPNLSNPIHMLQGWEKVQGELLCVPNPLCDEILRVLPATKGSDWRQSQHKYTFISFRRNIRSILELSLSHLASRNGYAQTIVWVESVEQNNGVLNATFCFENIHDLENNQKFFLPKHVNYAAGHALETLVAGVPMRITHPESDRHMVELAMPNARVFLAGEVDASFPDEKDDESPRLCELKARSARWYRGGDVNVRNAYPQQRLWEKYLQCFLGECDLMIGYHDKGLLKHMQEYRTSDVLESLGGTETRDKALTVLNDVLEFVGQTVLEECKLEGQDKFNTKKLFRLRMTRSRESSRFSLYEIDGHDFDWFHGDLIEEMKERNLGFVIKNSYSSLSLDEVPGGSGPWNVVEG